MGKRRDLKKNKSRRRRRLPDTQFNKMNSPGFDYGIKPSALSMCNPEFIDLWAKAKCIGVAYTVIPQLGLRVEVPTISIVFKHNDIAVQLFKLFKKWMAPPCDSSAIILAFVEYEKELQYNMALGVDSEQLVLRNLGEEYSKDYEIITSSGCAVKELPLSENYKEFKSFAQGREIFVCAMKNIFPENIKNFSSHRSVFDSRLMDMEHGFFKNDIQFLTGSNRSSSKETIYSALSGGKIIAKEDSKFVRKIPTAEEVFLRRQKQLRRFFSILLMRLKCNKSYLEASNILCKYAEWQVVQAACNIYARHNWPKLGQGKDLNMIGIYDQLRNSAQDVYENAMLTFEYDAISIEKQLKLDMKYLHDCVCPNSPQKYWQELKSKGYI